jgi:membrane-bound lytic murein transglycosylase MltF
MRVLFNQVMTWPIVMILLSWGCSGPTSNSNSASAATPAPAAGLQEEEPLSPLEFESALPESVRLLIDRPFTGDLDEMVKRRMIRVGVTFNRTHYFVDNGVQRGVVYEHLKMFEDTLNKKLKTGNLKVHVVFVPLRRDLLLPALIDGKVDVVAAILTVTPERRTLVDFSNPTARNVNEIVVTGSAGPAITTIDDLSGQEVFARKSSSYYQSLLALNSRFQSRGLEPVAIHDTPESLEDEDLLEMVNAGLIKVVVVDDYLATFWAKIFPNLVVHHDVALRTGGDLAAAFRKNSPKLAAEANDFIAKFGLHQAFGSVIKKRYLESTTFVKSANAAAERRKFESLTALFRTYSMQYDVDYLLMVAKGYQESGLNQNRTSPVGAIGVMQVMPATGQAMNVGDIRQVGPNIHAGVKYFRFMMDQYFKSDPMDDLNKTLLTHASYNAGPGRIRQLRREAARRGLDPNVWFDNVEEIVSARIGRETVSYVSNIYKYYIAYRLVVEEEERRAAARSLIRTRDKQ